MRKRTPSQPYNPNSQPRPNEPHAQPAEQPVRQHRSTQPKRRMNPVARIVNHWCDRLLGAVSDRSLASQEEEYASGRTTRDYICNTIGVGAFGLAFPLLTVIVAQLVGVDQAGMFSLAFVAGQVIMVIGNYGVRPYQVSDINEEHSFSDYQVNRWLTCIVMLLAGLLYCAVRSYDPSMFTISMGVYFYKMFDALGDVYEGRLQQADKLYLAGISQAFRSVCVVVVFTILLFITHTLAVACVAMAIAAAASFVVLTLPLAHFETPKSKRVKLSNVGDLFVQCFPLFLALFLYTVIDYIPVFAMESVLSYDNQLYYNSLYFPAQFVLLGMGIVYKPLLLRIANIWADPAKRHRFDLITFGIIGIIAAFTLFMILFMAFIGIPLMSFLYGVDYEQFRGLSYIFVAAGGLTACIDFLYQIITVLRRQRNIMRLYIITLGFALFIPILLVTFTGLPGAVIGYLIVMCILFVLIGWEYLRIRAEFRHNDNLQSQEEQTQLRPSEARAARERSREVQEKWSGRAADNPYYQDRTPHSTRPTYSAGQAAGGPRHQAHYGSNRNAGHNADTTSGQPNRSAAGRTTFNNADPTTNLPVHPVRGKSESRGRAPSASEDSIDTRPGRKQ